jgi:integrase/recombinase XerD
MARYLNELLTDFTQEHIYRGLSQDTIRNYQDTLSLFFKEANIQILEQLTTGAIRTWLVKVAQRPNRYTGKPLSPATVRHYDTDIRAFCNWLERNSHVPTSPTKALPRPKKSQGAPVVTFTASELFRIKEACKRDYAQNKLRDVALVYLLLDTGIRAGEAASIQVNSINWNEREVWVSGKTGRRVVPISTKTLHRMRRFLSHERWAAPGVNTCFTTKNGRAFTGRHVTEAVRRVTEAAGVEVTKRGPHMFRHTFAVEYLRGGGDVFSLKRILGHANISTTEAYIHFVASDISVKHAMVSPVRMLL